VFRVISQGESRVSCNFARGIMSFVSFLGESHVSCNFAGNLVFRVISRGESHVISREISCFV
jgi:hypothetical protein